MRKPIKITKKYVEVNIPIICPITPNFIKLKNSENTIPIQRLSDKMLKQLGKVWTNKLIENARKKRKAEYENT